MIKQGDTVMSKSRLLIPNYNSANINCTINNWWEHNFVVNYKIYDNIYSIDENLDLLKIAANENQTEKGSLVNSNGSFKLKIISKT